MWLLFDYNRSLHVQIIVLEEIRRIHSCSAQVIFPILESDSTASNIHMFIYTCTCLKWVHLEL